MAGGGVCRTAGGVPEGAHGLVGGCVDRAAGALPRPHLPLRARPPPRPPLLRCAPLGALWAGLPPHPCAWLAILSDCAWVKLLSRRAALVLPLQACGTIAARSTRPYGLGGGSHRLPHMKCVAGAVTAAFCLDDPDNTAIMLGQAMRNSLSACIDVWLCSCADFEDGHGCATGRQAGAFAALLTAVSVSVGLLHALCMPCSAHVTRPHQPRAALRQVSAGAQSPPPFAEGAPWCQPALRCRCLPTNGYVSKRMARVHAQAETGVRPAAPSPFLSRLLTVRAFPVGSLRPPTAVKESSAGAGIGSALR